MAQGPYVTGAFLCETLIQGNDNVLTAVRIVDTINAKLLKEGQKIEHGPGDRYANTGIGFVFNFVAQLKSGDYRGRGKVKVKLQSPSGKTLADQAFNIELLGDEHGQNIILQGVLPPEEKGVYWFEVYFDERLLTRSPLSVRLEESSLPTTSKSEAGSGDA